MSHTPFPPIVDRGETVTGTGGHRLRSWATAVVALLSTVLGLFPSTSMVWPGSQTACADVAVTVAVNPDHTPTAHLLDYRITAGHSHGPPATINGPAANGHTYYILADDTPVLVHNCGDGSPRVFEVNSAGEATELPILYIDAKKMPNIARNIQDAQDNGYPSILTRTTDEAQKEANRAAACAGFCGPGSPDEYPFASTMEGGAGARVRSVPIREQRIQGGVIAKFYEKFNVKHGDRFVVRVRW